MLGRKFTKKLCSRSGKQIVALVVWVILFEVLSTCFLMKRQERDDASKIVTTSVSLVRSKTGISQSKLTPNQPDLAVTNGHSLTLTIHIAATPSLINQLYCIALRSAALFWSPKVGHIGLIFDAESQRDHEFAAQLKAQEELLGFTFDVMYQPLPPSGFGYFASMGHIPGKSAGYNRQLWNSFFIDECVTTSIVAWTDADAMFTSPVIPESIFNGDKIRTFAEPAMKESTKGPTFVALGKKPVAQFTCLPLFLWRDTIRNCRNHILKHMKVTEFEKAFVKFRGYRSYPSNILFTYAFYFEHDRYDWHIRLSPKVLQQYNQRYLAPGFHFKIADLTPEMCHTMHKPYFDPKRIISHLEGYCTSLHYMSKRPENCEQFRGKTDFQVFEPTRFRKQKIAAWCDGASKNRAACAAVSDAYYKNVAKHGNLGLFNFDLKRVLDVEKAAMEMNVTCRKYEKLN